MMTRATARGLSWLLAGALVMGCEAGNDPGDAMSDAMPDAMPDAMADVMPDGIADARLDPTDGPPPDRGPEPDADGADTGADAAPTDARPGDAAVADAMPADAAPPDAAAPDGGPPWVGEGICDPAVVTPLDAIDRRSGTTADAPAGAEPSCSEGGGAPERVFTWIAPADGLACLSLAEAGFDTVLYVRRAACDRPDAEVACSDDANDLGIGVQSALTVDVEAGARYFAFVDGYAGGEAPASGDFTLEIGRGPCRDGGRLRCAADADCPAGRACDGAACVDCVTDDHCPDGQRCAQSRCVPGPMMGVGACAPDRLAFIDGFAVYEGDNTGAPADDLGSCNPGTVGPEVAHIFTPAADGPVCARTLGSPLDTVVYVRRACADPGSEVVCEDDISDDDLTSAADFDAVAGEPVVVFVDTYTLDDVGPYTLALIPGPCAEAPICADDRPCPDGAECRINACLPAP